MKNKLQLAYDAFLLKTQSAWFCIQCQIYDYYAYIAISNFFLKNVLIRINQYFRKNVTAYIWNWTKKWKKMTRVSSYINEYNWLLITVNLHFHGVNFFPIFFPISNIICQILYQMLIDSKQECFTKRIWIRINTYSRLIIKNQKSKVAFSFLLMLSKYSILGLTMRMFDLIYNANYLPTCGVAISPNLPKKIAAIF